MHDKAMKMLMAKKKGREEMSPEHKAAKLSVLKELRDQAMQSMGSKLHKKGSDSPKEGNDKMKDLVGDSEGAQKACEECGKHGCLDHTSEVDSDAKEGYAETEHGRGYHGEEGSPEEEASETTSEEVEEHADLSPEELDEKIAALQALKAKKEKGQSKAY